MKILFLFFMSIALTNPILATGASSTTKHTYEKVFGNCIVIDSKDMLTDMVMHDMWCIAVDKIETDRTSIRFLATPDLIVVFLSKGTQYHSKDYIDVMLRIDQHPLYTSSWYFIDGTSAAGYANNHQAFIGLLDQLA